MHSRIFEVREKGDTMRCEIPEWFEESGGHYCDYVEELEEPSKSIEWLKDILNCKEDNLVITKECIESYFKDRYEKFIEYAKKLSDATFEEFTENRFTIDSILYTLKTEYSDEQGFWMLISGEMYTLEEFLRRMGPGEYEIVRVWDYHF